VITLGDHGECFGEHGVWRHEHGLVPELTHVPLCVSGSRDGTGTATDDRCVSVLDVHRTILSLAGVEPDGSARGRNLEDPTESSRFLTEFHGLGPRKREMLRLEGVPEERIEPYDGTLRGVALESEYYGYETIAGFAERGSPPVGVDPTAVVDDLVADLTIRNVGGSDDDLPEEVVEHLRDLGYA